MQYLTHRHGAQQWISDGEPSNEALDAALLTELASRLGYDWQEATNQLEQEATDDAERENALADVMQLTDGMLCSALLRMITERRAELAATAAARAVGRFIVLVSA